MRKSKASALSQYSIIIALVAIVAVPGFYLVGKSLFDYFNNFSTVLNDNEVGSTNKNTNNTVKTDLSSITPGFLNGSTDDPKKICESGSCVIDYGTFVLDGVPEDYGDFVQSSGTSGGTDKLASLIEKIAKQLEEQGDTEGAKEYRTLATIGHQIADIQELLEEKIGTCDTFKDLEIPFNKSGRVELLPELVDILPGYNPYRNDVIDFVYETRLDKSRYSLNNNIQKEDVCIMDDDIYTIKFDSTSNPSVAFIQKYDDIMNNPKYSDAMKSVTQELYLNINDLSYNFYGNIASTTVVQRNVNDLYDVEIKKYDSLSGESVTSGDFAVQEITEIINPETSKGTDLNSRLICSTGKNANCKNPG